MTRCLWLLAHAAATLAYPLGGPRELLSEATYYETPKLLLFWPVDGSYRTVKQVKKNLDYAKASLGANCCDVFLAHYKGDARLFGQEWYQENVVGNLTGTGYKFKFMQEAYNKAQFEEPWETKYDFVWGLDSDVDLTGTNLTKLFRMVKRSNVLIAGPTFIGAGVNQRHPGGDLRRKAARRYQKTTQRQVFQVASNAQGSTALLLDFNKADDGHMAVEVSSKDADHVIGDAKESRASIWRFERPDPSCDYRHTDFVELTAPILTMAALPMIFNDCSKCIHEKSDWGLDMVWCNFLASKAKRPSSCALIDATPVNHLNWKQALPSKVFYEANREVHRKYRRFWSHFKTLSCVVVEPALPMQDLRLPGQRLVRKEAG